MVAGLGTVSQTREFSLLNSVNLLSYSAKTLGATFAFFLLRYGWGARGVGGRLDHQGDEHGILGQSRPGEEVWVEGGMHSPIDSHVSTRPIHCHLPLWFEVNTRVHSLGMLSYVYPLTKCHRYQNVSFNFLFCKRYVSSNLV